MFTSADHFIMKMQPYVDLTKGGGAPGETLLLDYTGKPKTIAWLFQIRGTIHNSDGDLRFTILRWTFPRRLQHYRPTANDGFTTTRVEVRF
jgi:hypothetical protein